MTHTIVRKENGNFGIKRIASGCVYGDFDTMVEAIEALGQSQAADATARRSVRMKFIPAHRAADDRLWRGAATVFLTRGSDRMTLNKVDYLARKKKLLKAYYFQRTYGRPYYAA